MGLNFGYSDDGMVWMAVSDDKTNKPVTTVVMGSEAATEAAQNLVNAAHQAQKARQGKIILAPNFKLQ